MAQISKHFDPANDLTSYTVTGKVAAAEVKQVIEQFYLGQVTTRVFWDLTGADLTALSKAEVESIALTPRTPPEKLTHGKTALVAPEDLAYGLSRMYQTLTTLENMPFEARAFRTTKDAMNWLLAK